MPGLPWFCRSCWQASHQFSLLVLQRVRIARPDGRQRLHLWLRHPGEVFAWIIGWDLILEYALGAVTVSIGWSGYVVSFLHDIGIDIPAQLSAARGTLTTMADGTQVTAIFNLPAVIIIGIVTLLLVIGIKESANTNNVIVIIKVAVVLLFIAGAHMAINSANWHPFIPPNTGVRENFGWTGVVGGAGVCVFCLHRI